MTTHGFSRQTGQAFRNPARRLAVHRGFDHPLLLIKKTESETWPTPSCLRQFLENCNVLCRYNRAAMLRTERLQLHCTACGARCQTHVHTHLTASFVNWQDWIGSRRNRGGWGLSTNSSCSRRPKLPSPSGYTVRAWHLAALSMQEPITSRSLFCVEELR